ncbi:MAG TPA: T9SS type A sorting domain-containing protein, partial [Candidatus Kapabacteria bacterium]|nr:T9SS type A sorting domain-containing protein [Candidatus Kapabacteria bacterium]
GLQRNKAYLFKVFEYNGTGTSINSNPNGATGNPRYRKTNLKETADEFQLVLGDRFSIVGFAPNPVRDQFSFEILTNEALQFTIDVQNEQGLTVYSMSKDLGEGQYPFTIKLGNEYKGQLPAGAYFLRVSSGGETLTQKFIYMP